MQVTVAQLAEATVFPAVHFVLPAVEPLLSSNNVLHAACAVQQAVLSAGTVLGAHGAPAQAPVAEAVAKKPSSQSEVVIAPPVAPLVF